MKKLMDRLIEEFRNKVKQNLEVINENQAEINIILKQHGVQALSRMSEYESKYQVNKDLLSVNNEMIKVQITLLNFLEKYKNTDYLNANKEVMVPVDSLSKEEVLELTKQGEIIFDESHPYFTDKEFFEILLNHYQKNEAYEMCQLLLGLNREVQ